MLFLTSVFLVLSSRNCSADEPNSLGLEAANIHFCKNKILNIFHSSWQARLELQESFANATQPSFLNGLLWKVSASEKSVVPEKKESFTIPQNIVDRDCSSNRRLKMKHEQAAASGVLNWNNNMLSKLTNHILVQFSRDWYHAHIAICMRTIN